MAKKVSVNIQGKETVSKASSKAGRSLGNLKGKVSELNQGAGALTGGMGKLGSVLGKLGPIAIAVGTALKGIQKAGELAILGGKVEGIRKSFESMAKQAGVASDTIIREMKAASQGTISEFELLKNASTAALLGVPIDKFGKLMEIARASAVATGQTTQEMFQSIATGVGRQSKLLLDNLGIIVSVGKANEEYAKSVGKSTS